MKFVKDLVPASLLLEPPSVRQGNISLHLETEQRSYGCALMQKAGIVLTIRVATISTAHTVFHRFYFMRSLTEFDVRNVATACLYLACKLEEDPRRLHLVINVFHYLQQEEDRSVLNKKTESSTFDYLEISTSKYILQKDAVLRIERCVLRELGFRISEIVVHPHKFILQYITALLGDELPQETKNGLSQSAWGYINDSFRTNLCCRMQPSEIAVGSIYLAAYVWNVSLPPSSGWYCIFDVEWADVITVCTTILALYKNEQDAHPRYVRLVKEDLLLDKVKEYVVEPAVPLSNESYTADKQRSEVKNEDLEISRVSSEPLGKRRKLLWNERSNTEEPYNFFSNEKDYKNKQSESPKIKKNRNISSWQEDNKLFKVTEENSSKKSVRNCSENQSLEKPSKKLVRLRERYF